MPNSQKKSLSLDDLLAAASTSAPVPIAAAPAASARQDPPQNKESVPSLFAELGLAGLFDSQEKAGEEDKPKAQESPREKPQAEGKATSLDALLFSMTGISPEKTNKQAESAEKATPKEQPPSIDLFAALGYAIVNAAPKAEPAEELAAQVPDEEEPLEEAQPQAAEIEDAEELAAALEGAEPADDDAPEAESEPAEEPKSVRSRFADIPTYNAPITPRLSDAYAPEECGMVGTPEEPVIEPVIEPVEAAAVPESTGAEAEAEIAQLLPASQPEAPETQKAIAPPSVPAAPRIAPGPVYAPAPATQHPNLEPEPKPQLDPEADAAADSPAPETPGLSGALEEPETGGAPAKQNVPEERGISGETEQNVPEERGMVGTPEKRGTNDTPAEAHERKTPTLRTPEKPEKEQKTPGKASRTAGIALIVVAIAAAIVAACFATGVVQLPASANPGANATQQQQDILEDKSATQAYEYQIAGLDGQTYDVVETALFNAAGYLEHSVVTITVPDQESAQKILDQMQADFGDLLTNGEAAETAVIFTVKAAQGNVDKKTYDQLMAGAAAENVTEEHGVSGTLEKNVPEKRGVSGAHIYV